MIIGKRDKEEFERLYYVEQRVAQAHRWLAEFDDVLSPMWVFLLNTESNQGIEVARKEMREAFKKKVGHE